MFSLWFGLLSAAMNKEVQIWLYLRWCSFGFPMTLADLYVHFLIYIPALVVHGFELNYHERGGLPRLAENSATESDI
jgi:hypothetical protein